MIKEVKYTKFSDIPKFISDGDYRVQYPMASLLKFIDEEVETQGLQLNPDFQRGHVWTPEQQSAWLEYHIRGGNSGNIIYLNNPDWHTRSKGNYHDYVCVDGLQRISAIRAFLNNKIKVFGSYINEYEDKSTTLRNITSNTLYVVVNDLKTKEEVLQWYIDMNSGGTPHSQEEIDRVKKLLEAER